MGQRAEGFGKGRHTSGVVTGLSLQDQNPIVSLLPATQQLRQHAHGFYHLGIAQVLVGEGGGSEVLLVGVFHRLIGQSLVGVGQGDQYQRTDHGEPAEPRMEHEHHCQVHRQPGGVEEGEQAIAGEELAQAGHVAEWLRRSVQSAGIQRLPETGTVQPFAEQGVQSGAETYHDPRAYPLQGAHGS
ncbi:hypothetical protein D3C78_1182640 [compost metagenome]